MAFTTIREKLVTEPYCRIHLRELFRKNVDEAKKYVGQYFFPHYEGIYFNTINEKNEPQITNIKIRDIENYIPKNLKKFNDEGKVEFTFLDWFKNYFFDVVYVLKFDPSKPALYKLGKVNYLNCFFNPYPEIKDYDEFDDKVKKSLQIILDHILNIWCEKNKEVYEYTINWLCNALHFIKNKTLLYIASEEGTGKGIILDWLRSILKGLSHTTAKTSIITGFNYNLLGKTMLIMEELPTMSVNEWQQLNGRLKDMVTSNVLDIEGKFKDIIQIENLLSILVITNHDALKTSSRNRRAVALAPSSERLGDIAYYTKLANAAENKETAHCFLALMRKRFKTKEFKEFKFNVLPVSTADIELKLRHLDAPLSFLKEMFLLKKRNLKFSLRELYNMFTKFKNTKMTIVEFNKHLVNFGLEKKIKTINAKTTKCWEITHEELKVLFEKRHLIHEDDEFESDDEDDSDDESCNKITKERQEIIDLQNQLKELKKQLEEAKKEKKPKRKTKKSE